MTCTKCNGENFVDMHYRIINDDTGEAHSETHRVICQEKCWDDGVSAHITLIDGRDGTVSGMFIPNRGQVDDEVKS